MRQFTATIRDNTTGEVRTVDPCCDDRGDYWTVYEFLDGNRGCDCQLVKLFNGTFADLDDSEVHDNLRLKALCEEFEVAKEAYAVLWSGAEDYWRSFTVAEWAELPLLEGRSSGNPQKWNACVTAARKLQNGGAL